MTAGRHAVEDADPAVGAVVRTFDDNAEIKLSATQFLADLRNHQAGLAEDAVRRLDHVDAATGRFSWRILLYSLLIVVSAAVWTDGLKIAFTHTRMGIGPADLLYGYPPPPEVPEFSFLDNEQRLLVLGDTSRASRWERMKGLWESEPENPVYFAAYAEAYLAETRVLPPDLLQTARRIGRGCCFPEPGCRFCICLASPVSHLSVAAT